MDRATILLCLCLGASSASAKPTPIYLRSLSDATERSIDRSVPAPDGSNRWIGPDASLRAHKIDGTYNIFIGACAGSTFTSGSHNLLIGDYTSAPDGAVYFANIDNVLCFWRTTGETVACPPPAKCRLP